MDTPRPTRRRGQALVEMALVLPVLLLLTLGLVGVGQILLASQTLAQAARAAAHQAAIAGGAAGPATQAAEAVIRGGVGMRPEDATITVSCPAPCRRYAPVTVEVTYRGALWTPMPGILDRFTLRSQATRANERDRQ